MTDELERRVRDALHRASLPAAPDTLIAHLERLPTLATPVPVRRRGLLAGLWAAIAVAVVVVAVSWLPGLLRGPAFTPSSSPGAGTSSAPSASPSGLVPWIDATPGPVPSASPVAIPPGTRTCGPGDLTASAGWQGATGQMAGGVIVTNTSSTACVVMGAPRQVALLAGTTTLRTTYVVEVGTGPGATATTAGQPVYLEPGGQATAFVTWSNWCGATRPTVTAVTVTLPDGGRPITAGATPPGPGIGGVPRCDVPTSGSTVTAGEFEPVPAQQPATEPVPASVSISAPASATAGQVLEFTVTVTNIGTTSASLDPCPTYTEDLIVGGRALKPPALRGYLLNCPLIGSQIAPGASVVLAMRYPVPSDVGTGPVELLWGMDPGGPFDAASASTTAPLMIEGGTGPGPSSQP